MSLALVGLLPFVFAACDPASVHGPLTGLWTAQQSSAPIAAKPAVGNSTVYMGSWSGYETAYGETSGAPLWSAYLGVTQANCQGLALTHGVTSSPWLQGGMAYLGGGGSTWDALDAATGDVLWTVPTGDNSVSGGHYNWSSPAVSNGFAYVGIASFCDSPLVQGELLRVNLTTYQIDSVFKVVPDGEVGGGIWTTPVVDPVSNTVFVSTGNGTSASQSYAQAIVALDADTLAVKSSWSLPANDPTTDADFGTSPVLFTDSTGRALVAVTNKNGVLYAFQRDDLSAGPVWQTRIAASSDTAGGGTVSTGFFDGQRLYYAAGLTTIGGKSYAGSIRAISPTTGAFLWERGLPAFVYGALAGANGMVVVPVANGGLYVLSGADGSVQYANALAPGGLAIIAPPVVADGTLVIGTTDGVVHAFSYPAAAAAAAAASHAGVAAARRGTTQSQCVVARARLLAAHCRLAVRASRCARLGQLPSTIGAVGLDRITIRVTGTERHRPAVFRVYRNGLCAGRAALRLATSGDRAARSFKTSWDVPPGSVFALRSSRSLRVELRVVGHARHDDANPGSPAWGGTAQG
jgi:outer membrane protein assembly factor BamB